MTVLTFPEKTRPAQQIAGRIEALKRHIGHMAAVNMMLAAGDIEGLQALGYDDAQIAALKTPDSMGAIGFSARTFTDVEAKIKELERGITVPPITEAPGWDGRA